MAASHVQIWTGCPLKSFQVQQHDLNPKFCENAVQNDAPEMFSWHKNTFKQSELDAKSVSDSKIIFVEQLIMETPNGKPSLLRFLC